VRNALAVEINIRLLDDADLVELFTHSVVVFNVERLSLLVVAFAKARQRN
jgi:hypothetical protein